MGYEEEETKLYDFCKKILESHRILKEKWPALADKYSADMPERIVQVMKEILCSKPINLDLAYKQLGNFARLKLVSEELKKDVDITKKLDCSSNLYFLGIEQAVEEQNNFSRYFKIKFCDRTFYLASLKYFEEYTKKINTGFEELTQLQNAAQNAIISLKEQSHIANFQNISKTINSPLPSKENLITELEKQYNNPTVIINNESEVNAAEIIKLLNNATLKCREITRKRTEITEALKTLNIVV